MKNTQYNSSNPDIFIAKIPKWKHGETIATVTRITIFSQGDLMVHLQDSGNADGCILTFPVKHNGDEFSLSIFSFELECANYSMLRTQK